MTTAASEEIDSPTLTERIIYLFGFPISKSLSPVLHETVFEELDLPYSYELFESMDTLHFISLLKEPKVLRAAVTMPHKRTIIPYLNEITPECKTIGACNTIFKRRDPNGGQILSGTNTDCIGVREAFLRNVPNPEDVYEGKPGLVIGAGGACRSAIYALSMWLKCEPIYIINRDEDEVDELISECRLAGFTGKLIHVKDEQEIDNLDSPGAVVSCIPDLPLLSTEEIGARKLTELMLNKKHRGAFLELCYHPLWTGIVRFAKNLNWQVILGTEIMAWQALEQDRIWLRRDLDELPVAKVRSNIETALSDRDGY